MSRVIQLAVIAVSVCSSATGARAQNTISTIAGGGNLNVSLQDLGSVTSVAVNGCPTVYFSVAEQHVIYSKTGGTLGVAVGTGVAGFSGDGGPATAAQLDYPQGLALDANCNLFIADTYNNRIREVNAATGVITTVAGSGFFLGPQSGQFAGDGGPATAAVLSQPSGVALDAAGNMFICDTFNSVIREVDVATQNINTIAGSGFARGGSGDGGPALSALMNLPSRVAVDSNGNIYVSDTQNSEVREVFNNAGTLFIRQVGIVGAVVGVATDSSGNAYATDLVNHFVVKFTPLPAAGQFAQSTVAGNNVEGFSGDGGSPTSASLNFPNDVAIDPSGNLFIADTGNQRVRMTSNGPVGLVIQTIAGGGNGGDNGPAASATLSAPTSIAFRPAFNELLVSDSANQRIRSIPNPAGANPQISTIGGNGIAGFSLSGIPATQSSINTYPLTSPGVNDDTQGLTAGQITVDSNNNIFIVDTGSLVVHRIDGGTGIMTVEAGIPNSPCFQGGCGDGGASTSASFAQPLGVAVDAAGNVYISDQSQNRVRKADTMGNINNFAGDGTFCTNSLSSCGDGGPAASAQLANPAGLAIDPQGNLLIADSFNGRIRRVTPNGSSITTIAFNGQQNDTGDGGPAISAAMLIPTAMAVDAAGNIFVSSNLERDVRRIDAATQTVARIAGLGEGSSIGFSGDGGPAVQAQLNQMGIALDGNHNLYIADAGNNRIRMVHLVPTISVSAFSPFGPTPVGTTSQPQVVTVTNSGADTLTIATIVAQGGGFAQTNLCGASLAPALTCTISVTFTPGGAGAANGTLTITSNDPANPSDVIPLSGNGVSGGIATLKPQGGSTLAFGNQALGTSNTLLITLTNTGTGTLTLGVVTIQPNTDFTETSNCTGPFPPAPAAGSSCTFNVTFNPSALGARVGTIVVDSDDPNNPSQTINLTGTGTPGGRATLNPTADSTLAFGNEAVGGTSAAQTITLTNTGTGPLAFQRTAIFLVSGQTAQFTPSNNCPASLPPAPAAGSSCTISVGFTPTMLGPIQQQLGIFTDDVFNGFQAISLTGTGVNGFVLSIAPGGSPTSNVNPGSTAVFPLILTSNGGFTGTVSLSCVNPTNTINCTVTPPSIPISGSGTTNTAISVHTFCSWIAPPKFGPRGTNGRYQFPRVLLLGIFAALALIGGMLRMRPRRLRLAFAFASLILIAGLGASCGDPGPNGATAPGSYPLTITASGGGLTSSVNLTLNVQ